MDESSVKDVGYIFLQLWSTLVVALVIYGGGITAGRIVVALWPQTKDIVMADKTMVLDPSLPVLFRLWYTTRYAHPFVVGALIGRFVPALPHPDFVTSPTSLALWFGFAGIGNGQVALIVQGIAAQGQKLLDLFVPWVRQRLGLPARLTPVPAPATDPMPSKDDIALPKEDRQ